MARLYEARRGNILTINSREIEFSLWPTKKTSRRDALNTRIFISNPWNIIQQSVQKKCNTVSKRQALAFLD